jgi:predicted DNA-binding transcriptional regulator AlpA
MISLDDLVAGKSPASRDEAVALLAVLAAAQTRLAAIFVADVSAPSADGGCLLTVDQAALKLGETPAWLYRRTKKLPFVVRLGGHVRYSSAGLEQFIAARRGR